MAQTDRTASSIQLAAQWSTATAGRLFSDESRFNLWHHDGRIRVRRYAGERHIPECIIERRSRRTPGVMVWGAIAYHGRSQLLRIVDNLNSTLYINEVLQTQAILFLQGLLGAVFQQDNARSHVAKTVKSYLDSQQVQLFLGLRIRRICHRLNMCGISLGGVSLVIFVLCFDRRSLVAHTNNMEYSSAGRYSKFV
ncbi:transposable element Tcb1 transposase [Trichonephila clavipes]|nr:transposable element Tcb1 transposase [Trichonephila clavipes]